MGKQAILRNIESFLNRLMIHLIKNQIEQRLLLIATDLVNLTYCHSIKALEEQLDQYFTQLPGGEEWNTDY